MNKFGFVIAALGAIAIAAPSIASAETVVIKHRNHHSDPRAELRVDHHHGWHHGWHESWHHHHHHADKTVIIKN